MYFYGKGHECPIIVPEAIKDHLPLERRHHFKAGRSMAEAATCWMARPGQIPPEIAAVTSERHASAVHFEFEQAVYGGGRSQTDVMAFAGDLVIAVEAKVDEEAGPTMAAWLAGQKASASNRTRALESYAAELGVEPAVLLPLRYQYLHRALSAALVAKAVKARIAWMIVQLFPAPFGYDPKTQESYHNFTQAVGGRLTLAGRHVATDLVLSEN